MADWHYTSCMPPSNNIANLIVGSLNYIIDSESISTQQPAEPIYDHTVLAVHGQHVSFKIIEATLQAVVNYR